MVSLELISVITEYNYFIFVSFLSPNLRSTVKQTFIDLYSVFLVITLIPTILWYQYLNIIGRVNVIVAFGFLDVHFRSA
jgi:hypothetical protein